MPHTEYGSSPNEGWQDLVAWDDEFFFQDEPGSTGVQCDTFAAAFHIPESVTSEQPYLVSAPPSVVDDPPSLEYTVSAPPSILDGSSSFGQVCCTSPFFDITATSPLVSGEDGRYFGSFGACDDPILPLGHITESPVLDTRFERIEYSFEGSAGSFESTSETVFNPYVAGSSHSFSGLDIRASQVFSNVGTWAEQPQIIEPIAECDESRAEAAPISIRRTTSQSFHSSAPSHLESEGHYTQQGRSRAITIPEASRGALGYNFGASYSGWSQRVPPLLSGSPVTQRRHRGVSLSRSASQSRRKPTTPSPTSASSDSYGWVSYQPNPFTNRLAPTSTEGMQGRTPRGRKKGLTAEQRSHAALMRIVGACSNCQRRKEKCDPGTPCKSCLEHYKGDLVKHPCRDRLLSDLSSAFLSDRLGWHPTARSVESFVAPSHFNIHSGITYTIPLNFGFGPALSLPVNALQVEETHPLVHKHIIYSWPPESSSATAHTHAVLPAVLTKDAMSNLIHTLDSHLSLLVTNHFRAFPLYCSPLRILREVYVFSRSIPPNAPHARTLHQALKLLVLVHIGGDITLPPRSQHPVLAQLVRNTMDLSDTLSPTPCFIRSQFGSIMPELALILMKDVLSSLEQLLLNRECAEWPMALAVLITVLMTVESIHYHAAKLPYHYDFNNTRTSNPEEDLKVDDEGVRTLLAFYSACFSGCHARLRPDWEGEVVRPQRVGRTCPEDTFVENVREAIKKASGAGYLARKASEKREGDDMGFFFDRLAARLLLLKP
ncbi:Nn.00g098580.m01.CDS01 [Neocucurbitaria sp. VM-36]